MYCLCVRFIPFNAAFIRLILHSALVAAELYCLCMASGRFQQAGRVHWAKPGTRGQLSATQGWWCCGGAGGAHGRSAVRAGCNHTPAVPKMGFWVPQGPVVWSRHLFPMLVFDKKLTEADAYKLSRLAPWGDCWALFYVSSARSERQEKPEEI